MIFLQAVFYFSIIDKLFGYFKSTKASEVSVGNISRQTDWCGHNSPIVQDATFHYRIIFQLRLRFEDLTKILSRNEFPVTCLYSTHSGHNGPIVQDARFHNRIICQLGLWLVRYFRSFFLVEQNEKIYKILRNYFLFQDDIWNTIFDLWSELLIWKS